MTFGEIQKQAEKEFSAAFERYREHDNYFTLASEVDEIVTKASHNRRVMAKTPGWESLSFIN